MVNEKMQGAKRSYDSSTTRGRCWNIDEVSLTSDTILTFELVSTTQFGSRRGMAWHGMVWFG